MAVTIPEDVRRRFREAGQDHVFRHFEGLADAARRALLAELEAVDLALVAEQAALISRREPGALPSRFEPPELVRARDGGPRADEARARGAALLAGGEVAYLLVAGGQGSRLGLDGPKGMFPVGPVSGRSLFEVHARRLRRARHVHGRSGPWYVMTSTVNDAETRAFFDEHGYFGLDPVDVRFFVQEMLPALDEEGRILLSGPGSLFLAPNGHGGSLSGLARSGALEDMRRRGVRQISYFQVDNPLVRPADPLFLGLHDLAGAGMSSKVVVKRDAGEKVGVLGRVDGALGCIEYSDLPEALREAREADGSLRFRAGNIAVHALSVDFVEAVTSEGFELPWHVARKSIPTIDADGTPVQRTGFKFETFVFDALARTEASVTLEVERAHEFSPVKNQSGEDSPASARRDLCAMWAAWAREAGHELPAPDDHGVRPVEVDPLLAETREEFLAVDPPPPRKHEAGHLYERRAEP